MVEMTRKSARSVNCATAVCCAILLLLLAGPAFCDENATALMLEMSPSEGGYLNIVPGVHNFDMYAEVALKATPKPGYQFVCWLGNVTDTTSGATSVVLDSPKIVIAVFERTKFEIAEGDGAGSYVSTGGEGGGGGLVGSGGLPDSSLEQATSAVQPTQPRGPHIPGNIPVPPKQVPEPATIMLLSAGFLMLANRRKKGINLIDKT